MDGSLEVAAQTIPGRVFQSATDYELVRTCAPWRVRSERPSAFAFGELGTSSHATVVDVRDRQIVGIPPVDWSVKRDHERLPRPGAYRRDFPRRRYRADLIGGF